MTAALPVDFSVAPVDRPAAETALTRLVAAGRARRTAVGHDVLWTLA